MPLQIRRGLNAERTSLTPSDGLVEGELLYVTDSKRLFIGTGSVGEHQGVSITGYTDNDAKDAVADSLADGEHTGITFTYDSGTKSISATVNLSAFDGPIVADALKGSVFADDSGILVDAIDKKFYGDLNGSVFADDSSMLVDGANGLIVGDISSRLGGALDTNDFPIISSVGNITLTPDTGDRVVVNGDHEITGNLLKTGTLSVLSTALTSFGSNISAIDGNVRILRNTYSSTFGQGFTYAQHHATQEVVPLSLVRTRNTGASPTAVANGDEIANIEFYGHDGSLIREVSSIRAVVDGPVSPGVIPGRIEFRTSNGGATISAILDSANNLKIDRIIGLTESKTNIVGDLEGDVIGSVFADDSTIVIDGTEGGKITSPSITLSSFLKLPVYANDSARTAAIAVPEKGMVIFMTAGTTPAATNQMQVFDGTNWVNV
jgi:hypothetical protein